MSDRSPDRTVLIDFDGTLTPFTWPEPPGEPFPGVVRALKALKSAGYRIVIFTSRASDFWDSQPGTGKTKFEKVAEVGRWLTTHEIPFDAITADKQPAVFIVDDSALTAGPDFDWGKFAERVLRGEGHTLSRKRKEGQHDSGSEA